MSDTYEPVAIHGHVTTEPVRKTKVVGRGFTMNLTAGQKPQQLVPNDPTRCGLYIYTDAIVFIGDQGTLSTDQASNNQNPGTRVLASNIPFRIRATNALDIVQSNASPAHVGVWVENEVTE